MLQVLSSSVIDGATGVVRDIHIDLTFNQEVASPSITTDNFILYIDDGGTYTGRHEIIVNKDTETPTVLTITPTGDLLENTKYLLFVKGDTNIADAVIQGIYSTINETMSGHYILGFTTGIAFSDPDTEPPVEWPSPEDGAAPSVPGETLPIIVTRTSPYNGELVSSDLSAITITFSESINEAVDFDGLLSISVENADWPYDRVPEIYSASGFLLSAPTMNVDRTVVSYSVPEDYRALPNNTLYLASLDADSYTGSGYISSDYSWYFTSKYWPAYAHPRQIRQETGNSFNEIPDGIIWYFIHMSSLTLEEKTGLHWEEDETIPFYANRYVICLTILKLYHATSGSAFTAGSIIEKTLGDLTIKYDSDGSLNDGIPSWIEDCIETSLSALMGGRTRPGITVKSEYGYKYPGRRRSTI